MSRTLVNPELLNLAFQKLAQFQKESFVPAGDPSMDPNAAAQQGGGGAPGGSPGGDPSQGGGAPPDPSAGGGGAPPVDPSAIAQQVVQMMPQMQGGGMGGGMGGSMGGEPIKPKIDVNVTMLQILKILARIADALGVQIPASEMVATQGDLTQFGMQQQTGAGGAGPTAPAGGGAQQQSAIPPIQPMQGAAPGMKTGSDAFNNGIPFTPPVAPSYTTGLGTLSAKAAAYSFLRRKAS